jgi:glycogen debranching enzyme
MAADLHDLITVLHAPDLALSASDGQLRTDAHGWYSKDRRALARLEIELDSAHCATIGQHRDDPSAVTVISAVTMNTAESTDPTLTLSRHRVVSPSSLTDRVELTNHGATAVTVTLRARVGTDLAGVDAVRAGRLTPPARPLLHDNEVRWENSDITVVLRSSVPPTSCGSTDAAAELSWDVELAASATWMLELAATCELTAATAFTPTPAAADPQWTVPDHPLIKANLADLRALLLSDPEAPDNVFAAAGAPWYLTLFGRDALWTARLLLPLGTDLAAGTLRTLARRQGVARRDGSSGRSESEEAPGKILHEARTAALNVGSVHLPAIYYGTIDATALWVCLLHDAWQAGMPEQEVAALLPNLVAAMEWITGRDADPDGDGLLKYSGSAHGGLSNQGWKDSADAIRHLDGEYAAAPVALCEVQGYAYAAAVGAATLAGVFGLDPSAEWLAWAGRLRDRFHASFWLRDSVGDYPAIALDAGNQPVSGAASNMGHLLGTGLLSPEQAASVAARLAAPDLTTRFGLRTLTTTSAAYNPISYHCGSIWPHDTAIAIAGLAAEGHHDLAGVLSRALLRAAAHFDGRPPELYGLIDDVPVHYPSACRPQAWSAAAMIVAAFHAG